MVDSILLFPRNFELHCVMLLRSQRAISTSVYDLLSQWTYIGIKYWTINCWVIQQGQSGRYNVLQNQRVLLCGAWWERVVQGNPKPLVSSFHEELHMIKSCHTHGTRGCVPTYTAYIQCVRLGSAIGNENIHWVDIYAHKDRGPIQTNIWDCLFKFHMWANGSLSHFSSVSQHVPIF